MYENIEAMEDIPSDDDNEFTHYDDYDGEADLVHPEEDVTGHVFLKKAIRSYESNGIIMDYGDMIQGVRGPPHRPAVDMCCRLLQEIEGSVTTFSPSRSLGLLARDFEKGLLSEESYHKPTAEVDLVCSGGGLKGYYAAGGIHVLLRHLSRRNMVIRRVAGTSAGSWVGFFIVCGVSTEHWLETYHASRRNPTKPILDVYVEIWHAWMKHVIPENAYELCTGKLFITVTVITPFGLRERVISTYTCNDDIFQACCASSHIPFVTSSGICAKMKGEYMLDGGLSNNCPFFTDGERRQIVFRLTEVEYPFRLMVSPTDSCIEALVVRGGICMKQFLEGEHSESLSWMKAKDEDDESSFPFYIVKSSMKTVVAPVVIVGLILYRGTGMRYLRYFFKGSQTGGGGSELVPFGEAAGRFYTSTVGYVFTQISASVVATLKHMGFLM